MIALSYSLFYFDISDTFLIFTGGQREKEIDASISSIVSLIILYYYWHYTYVAFQTKQSTTFINKSSFTILLYLFTVLGLLQICFYGSVGQRFTEISLIHYIFLFAQPSYIWLFLIYSYPSDNLHLRLSILTYIIVCIFSGFLTYLFVLIPLFISKKITKFWLLKAIIFAVAFFPIFRFIKHLAVSDPNLSVTDLPKNYLNWIFVMINRFDFSNGLVGIAKYESQLDDFMASHNAYPFNSGYILSFITKIFSSEPVSNLNNFWHELVYNTEGSHFFPLAGYFYLSPFTVASTFLLVLFFSPLVTLLIVALTKLSCANKNLHVLHGVYLVFILSQGWFWSYMTFTQALIVYLSVSLLFSKMRLSYVR